MGAPITDIGPTQLDSFFSSTIKNYKTTIKENFIKYRPEIEHFMQGAERDEGRIPFTHRRSSNCDVLG